MLAVYAATSAGRAHTVAVAITTGDAGRPLISRNPLRTGSNDSTLRRGTQTNLTGMGSGVTAGNVAMQPFRFGTSG